ncbi:MAG: cell division protein FtsI [bacterium]|nr:cell division protein FtsI [bacterium]
MIYKYKKLCIFLLIFVFFSINFSIKTFAFPKNKLIRAIKKFEDTHSQCAVVILDAQTARILFVYNPEFALRKRFPPGSITKPWSAIIFMENAPLFNFSPFKRVTCQGKFFPPPNSAFTKSDRKIFNLPLDKDRKERYFRCSIKKGHGQVDLRDALVQSCNVYFLTYASRNPVLFHKKMEEKWHLNASTSARLISSQELPGRSYKELPPFKAAASAIGEGGYTRVSPLKVAQVYAALLEGSPILSPFERPHKKTIKQYSLNIQNTHQDSIRSTLSRVLYQGTLKDLRVDNKRVKLIGGKTGTGTMDQKKYSTHAWNVIHFDYKNRSCVMTVFVYKGMGGKEGLALSQVVLNKI